MKICKRKRYPVREGRYRMYSIELNILADGLIIIVLGAVEVSLPTELFYVRCGLAYYIRVITLYKPLYVFFFWRLSVIYQFTNSSL